MDFDKTPEIAQRRR